MKVTDKKYGLKEEDIIVWRKKLKLKKSAAISVPQDVPSMPTCRTENCFLWKAAETGRDSRAVYAPRELHPGSMYTIKTGFYIRWNAWAKEAAASLNVFPGRKRTRWLQTIYCASGKNMGRNRRYFMRDIRSGTVRHCCVWQMHMVLRITVRSPAPVFSRLPWPGGQFMEIISVFRIWCMRKRFWYGVTTCIILIFPWHRCISHWRSAVSILFPWIHGRRWPVRRLICT